MVKVVRKSLRAKKPLARVSIQLRVREGCHEPQPCQKSLLRQPITPRNDARLRVLADLNPVRSVKTAISEDVTQKKKKKKMEQLLEGFAVTWGLMLPQFDRDVFDISPDKIAKVDNLHIPDLPMLHFPQNLTQNKKYSYHVTYHVTPKSFEQFLCGK